jgi:hypothetical protein
LTRGPALACWRSPPPARPASGTRPPVTARPPATVMAAAAAAARGACRAPAGAIHAPGSRPARSSRARTAAPTPLVVRQPRRGDRPAPQRAHQVRPDAVAPCQPGQPQPDPAPDAAADPAGRSPVSRSTGATPAGHALIQRHRPVPGDHHHPGAPAAHTDTGADRHCRAPSPARNSPPAASSYRAEPEKSPALIGSNEDVYIPTDLLLLASRPGSRSVEKGETTLLFAHIAAIRVCGSLASAASRCR